MKRRGSRFLLSAQIGFGFVTWISAGIFVNDCTSNKTFKQDLDKGVLRSFSWKVIAVGV